MKIEKVGIYYGKLSDGNLNKKAIYVVSALTNNPNFTPALPSLANFIALQEAFGAALVLAESGDRVKIAEKNQARLLLLKAFSQLAFEVNAQAGGDRAKLLSSGFDLAYAGEGSASIASPTDFKIAEGLNSGELKFSCKKVLNAISYLIEYTNELPTEDTKWTAIPCSTRELTIKGLRSGTRIYGRIKAIGTKGQEAASEILSKIVQ